MKYDLIAEAYINLKSTLIETVINKQELANKTPDIKTLLNSKKVYEKSAALYHKDINDKHIKQLLNEPSMQLRTDVFSHQNSYINPDHINIGLRDSAYQVKIAAIKHPNANSQNIDTALNDPDERVRIAALYSKSANNTHIEKGLNDKHLSVRQAAISNPNANHDNIVQALKDPHGSVRIAAINHTNVDKSHIDTAIKDQNLQVANDAVSHPLASKEQILSALNVKRQGSMTNKLTRFRNHPKFNEFFPTGKIH